MSRRSPRGVYQAGSSSQPTGQPGQARPGRPSGLLTNQATRQPATTPTSCARATTDQLSGPSRCMYMCICVSLVDYRVEIAGFNKIINVRLLLSSITSYSSMSYVWWHATPSVCFPKPKPQNNWPNMLLFSFLFVCLTCC